MSTTLSLPSSPLQSIINGVNKLFTPLFFASDVDTSDIWRLYRAAGRSDSVSPAAVRALSKAARAQ